MALRRLVEIGAFWVVGCFASVAGAQGPSSSLPLAPKLRTTQQFPSLPAPSAPELPPFNFDPSAPAVPARPAVPQPEDVYLPDGSPVRLPNAKRQQIRFSPRYGTLGNVTREEIEPGVQRAIYTGGAIITVSYTNTVNGRDALQQFEFAADNVVIWIRGGNGARNPAEPLTLDQSSGNSDRIRAELFLMGNVVIRSREDAPKDGSKVTPTQNMTRTFRAEQIYYDIDANRAIALNGDLELAFDRLKDTVHMRGREIQRLGRSEFRILGAGIHSSKLPSDPGIEMKASEVSFTETLAPRRNFLGIRYRSLTDEEESYERTITARNARVNLLGVPIFYTPKYVGDISEPLGPLQSIGFGNDQVFGFQLLTTWDIYKLIALKAPKGHSWRLNLDYLSDRGTGFGTDYDLSAPSLFGFGNQLSSTLRLYGIRDGGIDNIGQRGPEPVKPDFRYRALWNYQQELFADREPETMLYTGAQVSFQRQFAWSSDKNFLEQYYYQEFAFGQNQETFGFLHASNGPWYGSLLVQGGQDRKWMTETQWLPKADAALIGQSFFDLLLYDARASAGYAQ
ncbi:MAG: hypothetical protein ACRCZF_15050, partial [Gemmataceae bacterium]